MSLDKSVTFKITTLTPLHIGDGNLLYADFDFVFEKNKINVYDVEEVIGKLFEVNRKVFADFGKSNFSLKNILSSYELDVKPVYSFDIFTSPREIRKFIKNAYLKPYIPGSSIKGAIHTALWRQLKRDVVLTKGNYNSFKKTISMVGGESPYESFIRPVLVSDTLPLLCSDLSLGEVKIFNLKSENQGGWKDFKTRKNINDFLEARGVFVEVLKRGTTSYFQVKLDKFLLNNTVRKYAHLPEVDALTSASSLCRAINEHSLHIIKREKEFLKKYTQTTPICNFYNNLENTIKNLLDTNSCILRLAFGSGWRGMTGDWLTDEELNIVRKEERLGKTFCPHCESSKIRWNKKQKKMECMACKKLFERHEIKLFSVFPKSRRFINEHGQLMPLGWVKLDLVDASFMKLCLNNKVKTAQYKKENDNIEVYKEKTKIVDPAKARKAQLEIFKKSINPTQIASTIQSYLERIDAQDNDEIKKEMCRILSKVVKEKLKKRYNKAIKEGKKWALLLKEYCEKYGV